MVKLRDRQILWVILVALTLAPLPVIPAVSGLILLAFSMIAVVLKMRKFIIANTVIGKCLLWGILILIGMLNIHIVISLAVWIILLWLSYIGMTKR